MAAVRWQGGAAPIAQVRTYVMAGTWEIGDIVVFTIGSKSWSYSVTSTTIATFLPLMVTAFNALSTTDFPEFSAITASSTSPNLVLTADTTGAPFTCSLLPTESNGAAADAQTIDGAGTASTGVATTACTGPNHWSNAQNWSTGAVPVAADDVTIDGGPSILYDTDQNGVTLTSLTIGVNFPSTSEIGLASNTNPTNPSSGYPQYLQQRLKIGSTTVNIETGSRRVRLDLSPASTTVSVFGTGQPQVATDDALDLKLAATANLYISKGIVGVNALPGDTGTVAILDVGFRTNQTSDSVVRGGAGLTVTTLKQSGGSVLLAAGATTCTNSGGVLTVSGGAFTTLSNQSGTVYNDGTGTITTLNNLGTFIRRGYRTMTITNTNLYAGSITSDRNGTITFSNAIQLVQCRLTEGANDNARDVAYVCLGTNRTLAQA